MSSIAQGTHPNSTRELVPAGQSKAATRDTLDDALIEDIAAGDKASMAVLYARHGARVYRFIMRFVANEAMAEELVNEVFFRVWRNAQNFQGRSRVSTWLLGLARHQALGALRRRSTEPLDNGAVELIEDAADNAETIAIAKNTSLILRNCLAQLSPLHREIIDLVYYHGATISDAAAIIGIKQSTVKTRMFYARRRLAELLRAQDIATSTI